MTVEQASPLPEVTYVRWAARFLAAILFLFWGAFFVEHMADFIRLRAVPPLRPLLLTALHGLLLAAYVAAWKWELPASIGILVAAGMFFSQAAGRNFVPFFAVSILPALLLLYCRWRSSR